MIIMQKFELLHPCEENDYHAFDLFFENDPLVLFHMTPKTNLHSIEMHGFKSGKALGIGENDSVSYAKRSKGCFAHKGTHFLEDQVIIAAKFDTLDKDRVKIDIDDVYVYDINIQPSILGYCELPKGYKIV